MLNENFTEDGRGKDTTNKSDASGNFLNNLNEEKCDELKGKTIKEVFDQERIDNPRRRYFEIHFTDGSRLVLLGDYSILGWNDGSIKDRGSHKYLKK